jgi:hypothetical protein
MLSAVSPRVQLSSHNIIYEDIAGWLGVGAGTRQVLCTPTPSLLILRERKNILLQPYMVGR